MFLQISIGQSLLCRLRILFIYVDHLLNQLLVLILNLYSSLCILDVNPIDA